MATDNEALEAQAADILEAIAEGGQYVQIGDKQYRRAEQKTSFEMLLLLQHQNARATTNNGFGLAAFGD